LLDRYTGRSGYLSGSSTAWLVWPWCSRLCQTCHRRGDRTNGRNVTQPIAWRRRRPRTTPPCSVSWPRNVRPAKERPIASATTGTSGHGSHPAPIATVARAIAARWTGIHRRRERAGAKDSGPRSGRSSRMYVDAGRICIATT
jgi:hypothetical protein